MENHRGLNPIEKFFHNRMLTLVSLEESLMWENLGMMFHIALYDS